VLGVLAARQARFLLPNGDCRYLRVFVDLFQRKDSSGATIRGPVQKSEGQVVS